jgi:catechol 2,3-dioxygenase-like lactoylglutathione lyase family enzyme
LEHNPTSTFPGRADRGNSFFVRAMKINFRRIDHVQVCIPPGAEPQAREFYGRVLGLEEIEKPAALKENGGLWFRVADIQLHVGVEEPVAPSKRHPAFEVEDAPAVRSYLEGRGVRTRDETPVPGTVRFSLYDPFGNRIELLEKTGRG